MQTTAYDLALKGRQILAWGANPRENNRNHSPAPPQDCSTAKCTQARSAAILGVDGYLMLVPVKSVLS